MRYDHDEMKIPVKNYGTGVTEVFETEINIESDQVKKIKYPKRVWFIIGDEFCERFNFTGMASKFKLNCSLCMKSNQIYSFNIHSHSGALLEIQFGLHRRRCNVTLPWIYDDGLLYVHFWWYLVRCLARKVQNDPLSVNHLHDRQYTCCG